MDKTWTFIIYGQKIGQTLDKGLTFVQSLSNFCPVTHSTRVPIRARARSLPPQIISVSNFPEAELIIRQER